MKLTESEYQRAKIFAKKRLHIGCQCSTCMPNGTDGMLDEIKVKLAAKKAAKERREG